MKPKTNFDEMLKFASSYIPDIGKIVFNKSLVKVKTIVDNPEDVRPSLIYVDENKNFISILAGKVDTVFDIARQVNSHFNSLNFNK